MNNFKVKVIYTHKKIPDSKFVTIFNQKDMKDIIDFLPENHFKILSMSMIDQDVNEVTQC